MNRIMIGLLICCPAYESCSGTEHEGRIAELLYSLSADDISDENEFVPGALTNDYATFLADNGMTGDQLISAVGDVVRMMAVDLSTATNHYQSKVLSCGLYFLDCYGRNAACPTFEFVITNCVPGGAVDLASYYYCKADVESNCASSVYYSNEYWLQQRVQREEAFRGMLMALNAEGASSSVTNRALGLGMKALPKGEAFGLFDSRLILWWPAYATSSNRYVAAQRALQTIPPPTSSNYLNRVIAELEALPPGTMRMLSTNHLGQAWQE